MISYMEAITLLLSWAGIVRHLLLSNLCRNLINGTIVRGNRTLDMRDVYNRRIEIDSSSLKCVSSVSSWDTLIYGIKVRNSWESPLQWIT